MPVLGHLTCIYPLFWFYSILIQIHFFLFWCWMSHFMGNTEKTILILHVSLYLQVVPQQTYQVMDVFLSKKKKMKRKIHCSFYDTERIFYFFFWPNGVVCVFPLSKTTRPRKAKEKLQKQPEDVPQKETWWVLLGDAGSQAIWTPWAFLFVGQLTEMQVNSGEAWIQIWIWMKSDRAQSWTPWSADLCLTPSKRPLEKEGKDTLLATEMQKCRQSREMKSVPLRRPCSSSSSSVGLVENSALTGRWAKNTFEFRYIYRRQAQ